MKFKKATFDVVLFNRKTGDIYKEEVAGYEVIGDTLDIPLGVNRGTRGGWDVTLLETGHRVDIVERKTRMEAIDAAIRKLKRIKPHILKKKMDRARVVFQDVPLRINMEVWIDGKDR